MKINIAIAGYKAHASAVLKRLISQKNINVVCVFAGKDDNFCLLDEKSIEEAAREKGIPVYDKNDLTLETVQAASNKGNKIDLLLLVEWKDLLSEAVFSSPSYGTFNIHDSLLPAYRGSSPMNWAIINGLSVTGATFYRITKKADNGPIYVQEKISIDAADYAIDVLKKMILAYENAAVNGITAVLSNKRPVIQDDLKATYCAKRLPQDGLLNFRCDAVKIYNIVRALSYPFPGAYAFYGNDKVVINKVSVIIDNYKYAGNIPGSLLKTGDVRVLCGKGVLKIEEIKVFKDDLEIHDPKEFFKDRSIRLLSWPEAQISI